MINSLVTAQIMAECAVADMTEAGLTAQEIAIALAFQLNDQVEKAMPTEATRIALKLSLIDAPAELQNAAFVIRRAGMGR